MEYNNIAYCNFSLLKSEKCFTVTYKDKTSKNFQFEIKSFERMFSQNSDNTELIKFVKNIKQDALAFIEKNNFDDVLIALECSDDWRNKLLNAFKENGFFIYDILTKGEAENVSFYNDFEAELKLLFKKLLDDFKNDKSSILTEHKEKLSIIESAYRALDEKQMTVGIVGAMKAGKSTFLNALLGDFIMPAMDKRCTRRRFVLHNADEEGCGRRIKVWLLDSNSGRVLSEDLSIDADRLGWDSQQLRSYLFALNSPNLINANSDINITEKRLLDEFEKLPFSSEENKQKIHKALRQESSMIDTIDVVHPFINLSVEEVGKITFWDTPGPNAINDEANQNFKQQRFFSDRDIFKKAVEESSALIVIFDVMQQESEAQEEIFKIISSRKQGNSCTLIVANKVDQRPIREVMPIEQLLKEIQNQAYSRQKMLIRPPIPTSSRPAQLAREIMRFSNFDTAPKDLLDEYDQVERREDRSKNKDNPAKAVEQRSGILETEKLLKRFFKQAPGLAVLNTAIGTLLNQLNIILNGQKQIFSSYQKEQTDFENAASVINEGYKAMNQIRQVDIEQLEKNYDDKMSVVNEKIEKILKDSIEKLKNYWDKQFEKETEMNSETYTTLEGGAFTSLSNNFDKIEEHFKVFYKDDFINPITQYYKKIKEQLNEIEKKAAQKLKITLETRTYTTIYSYEKINMKKDITIQYDNKTKKDAEHIVKYEDRAGIGGGILGLIGGGVGAGLLLASGPVGWLIAGAAGGVVGGGLAGGIFGLGAGNVVGKWTATEETEQYITKDKIIKTYTTHLTTKVDTFQKSNKTNLDNLKSQMMSEITNEIGKTIDTLQSRLQEAQQLANDPNRKDKILSLQHSINEIETYVKPMSVIAERIGMTYIS